MKKFKLITILFASVFFFGMMSCEGPQGPAGADGTAGINGTNGSDGTDGVDGNVTCLECHTLTNMAAKEAQYEKSTHNLSNLMYNGQTVYQYAGGRKACARCHSHEGFTETQWTGADTTSEEIAYPHAITCKTCHGGHESFDFENDGYDYALTTMDAVPLIMDDGATVVDLKGPSNLCAHCHQPRTPAPVDDGTGNFTITSPYYGPHHGPQTTMLAGVGGYEFTGSATYPTPMLTTHFTSAKCVGCHMHEYDADTETGGHTWNIGVAACTQCHSDATSTDIDGVQTEIKGLLDDLKAALITAGVLDADGALITGTYTVDEAGAFYNYDMVEEDRSDGVHNPEYIKALLTNTIESFSN